MTLFALAKALLMSVIYPARAHAKTAIHGGGATFPYPVYSQWAFKYNQITVVQLNYQSIG